MASHLKTWNYAVIWGLLVIGLCAAVVGGAISWGTFAWLEGLVCMLGLVVLALRRINRPVHSISQILDEQEHPRKGA
jgi:hypothetical protein